MINWFLVPSTINISYGALNSDQRYDQTLMTIDSIRKYCKFSKIVVLESSEYSISEDKLDKLIKKIDLYIPYHRDKIINLIRKNCNNFPAAVKSPSELYLLHNFLARQNLIEEHDRVFKLGGRMMLNEKFDMSLHSGENIVIKTKLPSVQHYDVVTNKQFTQFTPYQYPCRLFSFPGTRLSYMTSKFYEMYNSIIELYVRQEYTDSEHIMYHCLQNRYVKEIDVLGISGCFSDTGKFIEE